MGFWCLITTLPDAFFLMKHHFRCLTARVIGSMT
jgi:hypothetical protein